MAHQVSEMEMLIDKEIAKRRQPQPHTVSRVNLARLTERLRNMSPDRLSQVVDRSPIPLLQQNPDGSTMLDVESLSCASLEYLHNACLSANTTSKRQRFVDLEHVCSANHMNPPPSAAESQNTSSDCSSSNSSSSSSSSSSSDSD